MSGRRVGVGCVLATVIVLLVGGCGLSMVLSTFPSAEHPDVDFRGGEISAARDAVVPELEGALATVVRRSGFEPLGPSGRRDRCEAGQDNFTRQDEYAYTCSMELRQLVAVPLPFDPNAVRLGEALVEGACPDRTDTDRAVADWDGSGLSSIRGSRGDCTPGTSVDAPEIERWVPARPSPEELERARSSLAFGDRCYRTFHREHCEARPLELEAAVAAVPENTTALAVLVARDSYYSVGWDCPWPASWLVARC